MMRLLIVSNVRVVRDALPPLLARHDGIDVVGTAELLKAVDRNRELRPDIVLFDAARRDDVRHVQGMVSAEPRCKVVAFGVKETHEDIVALAAAGTAGYVPEYATSADMVQVLQRAMCGELVCSPRAAASLYRQVAVLAQSGQTPPGRHSDGERLLSRRELQIASLIDRGLTNKQIARELGIEVATVKNHVHNICEKLCVHRRGEAAARVRAGLQTLPGGSAAAN
jgi:two-component system, NarL family, nitrate/nitrite response regulator NarL